MVFLWDAAVTPFNALFIFQLLAIVFLVLASMDYLKHGAKTTPACKAWLRIGFIFAAVSLYLFFQRQST